MASSKPCWRLHRARQGFVKARTAQANQIRGLLAEHGIIIPQGIAVTSPSDCPSSWRMARTDLPGCFATDRAAGRCTSRNLTGRSMNWKFRSRPGTGKRRKPEVGEDPRYRADHGQRLVASIGDAKNSRMAGNWRPGWDWFPKQNSSGGKQTLLGISKRGDTYLRTLLIHGARAVIRVAERKANHAGSWLAGSWGDGTRTWPPWHSPTRMPGSSGRCWHTTGTTKPITDWWYEHGFPTAPAASGAIEGPPATGAVENPAIVAA
jgi:transposase